jgi:hypothetical protein
MAGFAGARRTDSALRRHLEAYRFPDATVHLENLISPLRQTYAHIRAMPQVEASALDAELSYCARDPRDRPVLDQGPQAVVFNVGLDGRDGVALRRPKLLAGRAADPARAREALLDSRAAQRFGVRPGDLIRIRIFPEFGSANAEFRCDPRNQDAYQKGLPTRRDVRQILVKCPQPTPCGAAKVVIDRLHAWLERGADFAALARRYSDDPSTRTHGGRALITRGEWVQPLDSTAFRLRTGAISRPMRTHFGWHVVQALSPPLPFGQLVRLKVAGIKATTDPYPIGEVLLTPAFDRAYRQESLYFDSKLAVRLKHGAADLPAFRAAVVKLGARIGPGAAPPDIAPEQDDAAKIQRSTHHQAQALEASAAVGGLLAFVLLGQALVRVASLAAARHPTLRALGMTRRQLVALGVAGAGAIAVAAAGLAAAVAIALSPLTPIGSAKELEPTPGFAVDPLVAGLGAAAVLLAVLLAGVYAASRASREPSADTAMAGGVATAEALARQPFPPTMTSGLRLALTRGRGPSAVPVGATLLASILAVGVVAVALTFTASLDHLFSTPRLYGQNWDYRSNYGLPSPESVRANQSISDFARGDYNLHVLLNGQEVGLVAMDSNKGRIDPVVTAGRAPQRPDEILLGPKTLDALGLAVGDSVEAAKATRTVRMRIVGKGVVPEGVTNELGKGAAMTFRAYRRLDLSATASAFEARIAPEAERDATLARLERRFVAPAPAPPRTLADFGGVRDLPIVVSALLAALAAASLAHTLVTAVRRRRRHLAVLKTLGFDRRQLLATVGWQAATLVAVGLGVGLPLGIAAGRWGWYLFAEQIGVVPEPVTPVPRILLVVPATFLLAIVVAALPAWSAARTRVAAALRTE